MMIKLPQKGIELIKRFEGCHLTAYPDPLTNGKPYTIGWGSTRKLDGSAFKLGEKITQEQADTLLLNQLTNEYFPFLERIPYFSEMSEEQKGALLSFAYNLGANFYKSANFTTISLRLERKEWDKVPEALLLYRNPGTSVEAGLKRRRVAEGALWSEGMAKLPVKGGQIIALRDTILKKQPLQSYQLSYIDKKEVVKGKGYNVIESTPVPDNHTKVILAHAAGAWYIYNPHWEISTSLGGSISTTDKKSKILKVKYFPQRDSATVHAKRMCFSSSCAMMADYLKPNVIQTAEQEDDYYMKNYVFKYGDTTNSNAQILALRDLGITAEFRQNLSPQDVVDQIDKGIPVPVGFLHHGRVSTPSGDGHWVVIVGYDKVTGHWIVHDPYGELDVINGGYWGSTNGASQRYTFKNFNRRWEVNSDGTPAPGRGWGIIATSW